MTHKINIAVTELPVICGMNPYENIKKIIVKHWKAIDLESYNFIIEAGYAKPLTNNSEKIEHYTKKYKLNTLMDDANSCSSSTNAKELQKSKTDMINKINNDTNIPDSEKEDIKRQIDSLVYTKYGSKMESSAIDIYSDIYGVKVIGKQKCVRKLFSTNGNISWYIIGKLDGITEDDSTIIEIKNRTKALFKTIVEYEKIQMTTYMKLFQKQKCNLVECLDSPKGKIINVIPVQYNEIYWTMIDSGLTKYIKFMINFLQSQDEMTKLLTMSDDNYQKYYSEYTSKL